MAEEQELTGPDLAGAGISASELADGAMLLGHADGQGVLLVRRGAEVFAIAATCTHYGGPLAEGLFDGACVRCPWHHAAFDVANGLAARPPALKPVDAYEVRESNGRLFVGAKRSPHVTPAPIGNPPDSVVIVGAGAAGNLAAETLRAEGYEGPVTLIGPEPYTPYDRPNLSKDYLAGTAEEDWIPLRSRDFYADHRIELALGHRAVSIDADARTIALDDGTRRPYGALLLATGAEPVRLDIAGADRRHVHYLRSFDDSRSIIAAAGDVRSAVVVGASFIGMEVAASLRARNIEVHVVAPDEVPMAHALGEQLGRFVRSLHEEHGVVFHLGHTMREIEEQSVVLDDGRRIAASLVVIGIGVRPVVDLAESAGMHTDKGIVVDDRLMTSVPGIWAAGDIARWPDPHTGASIRVEHWVVAERQGKTAAQNILGREERFDAVPFFWSQHYDVPINYVGHAERWDRIDITGSVEDRDCLVAFRAAGRTLAVASIYRDRESLEAERALEQDDEAALQRLIPPSA